MAGSGEKVGRHSREPWGHPGDVAIRVHCSLSDLKGTSLPPGAERSAREALYDAAKRGADHDAAAELVDMCLNEDSLDRIIDGMMGANQVPQIVMPYPAYDDGDGVGVVSSGPRNVIPFAFAANLAEQLGAPVNTTIVQAARVGRTKLQPFPRFLYQPRFDGEVEAGKAYILADDVFTMGGTLASLRSHIVSKGGTIIAATALAQKDGFDQPFAIRKETLSQLSELYGTALSDLWTEQIGHGIGAVTENEGQTLIRFGLTEGAGGSGDARLQALRDRLAEAAAKCE